MYNVRFMNFKGKNKKLQRIFSLFWPFLCLLRDISLRKFRNTDLVTKLNLLIKVCSSYCGP